MHISPPSRVRLGCGIGRACPRRTRGSGGFSLIEVIVAMAIVATVVLALVSGLLMLVRTTESNNQRQQVRLALSNYSESIRAMEYRDCVTDGATVADYESDYAAGVANWVPELDLMEADITRVQYWDRGSRAFVDTCGPSDGGAQQITLEVTWRDRTDRAQTVVGAR